MNSPSLLNCPMSVRCEEEWESMKETGQSNIRHCERCGNEVHHITDFDELRAAMKSGVCVYISEVGDKTPSRVLGLPSSYAKRFDDLMASIDKKPK